MKGQWIAELVDARDVRPGSPVYLANPLTVDDRAGAFLRYAGLPGLPAKVWTLYEPWAKNNPWLIYNEQPVGDNPLGMLTIGLDENLR